jgi:hypothetical protein
LISFLGIQEWTTAQEKHPIQSHQRLAARLFFSPFFER